MSQLDGTLSKYFTDFEGRFNAQLSEVIPAPAIVDENLGSSSPYLCRVKARYDRELLRLLDDGMIIAVRNFRSRGEGEDRYTLMEAIRFWPEHFGLKGLRDYQYYPMQFEVIQQSVSDWETDDKSIMIVQLSAIPINYDLIPKEGDAPRFERGFSYPIIGAKAHILNRNMIKDMYNRKILDILQWTGTETFAAARKDPRLGTIKMFESSGEEIPIYLDFDSLVRYHFGIFAFTGGGKSNLLANILRRLLIHTKDIKIVIFDISCEYPLLLMDVFADESIPSKIVLETETATPEKFYRSIVKPKRFEDDPRILKAFEGIFTQGKVSQYKKITDVIPKFSDFLRDVETLMSGDKVTSQPNYVEALRQVEAFTHQYTEDKGYDDDDEIDQEFVDQLTERCETIVENYAIHEKSALRGWFNSRGKMLTYFKTSQRTSAEKGYSDKDIEKILDGDTRLICLSISEPDLVKRIVMNLTRQILQKRKREFTVKPYILFVWDEAQEFVSSPGEVTGIDKRCSIEVERLLRQGRKYGLGGCIATQRIAHLNTNALQQLHTYFISTLPRPYDRGLISNTFMIDKTILERTLEFVPGEWLLSSYIATGIANVPIFIKADNSEDELVNNLNTDKKKA